MMINVNIVSLSSSAILKQKLINPLHSMRSCLEKENAIYFAKKSNYNHPYNRDQTNDFRLSKSGIDTIIFLYQKCGCNGIPQNF